MTDNKTNNQVKKKAAKKKGNNPFKSNPTNRGRSELQDQSSRAAGRVKSFKLELKFKSEMMNEYLIDNAYKVMVTFDRMANIFRFTSKDPSIYHQIKDWQEQNMDICQQQLDALTAQREEIESEMEIEVIKVNSPTDYKVVFEFSHPSGHVVFNLMLAIDAEIDAIENIFHTGVIDDIQNEAAKTQAVSVIRGCLDRIYKVTNPGRREDGRFSTRRWYEFVKQNGFTSITVDMPLEFVKAQKEGEVNTNQNTESLQVNDEGPAPKKIKTDKKTPKPQAKKEKTLTETTTEQAEA